MKLLKIKTKGWTDVIDLTTQLKDYITDQGFENGQLNVFVKGSTAAITTIEGDENLYQDLKNMFEVFAPYKKQYEHHKTWGDDNGAAHLRASLVGPSETLPVKNGKLIFGTWQKIVLIDFDTSEREREVYINFTQEQVQVEPQSLG